MYFKNRHDAAMLLLPQLEKFKGKQVIILAVPRGAVPIAYYLAKHLGFPIDLMMAKKLGHPLNKEFAIGAVSLEDVYTEHVTGIPEAYVVKESARIREQLKENYGLYMGSKAPLNVKDKTVLVVDDGIATGKTLMAGIKMLRKRQPGKIVIVVPVSSTEAAGKIKHLVDEFICLYTADSFQAVGKFYDDFTAVEDEEVIALLKELNERELMT